MQLQFDKTAQPLIQPLKQQIKNVEQTQELRINDGMPDIGRVLGAWGQVILRTKEWQHTGAGAAGGVQVSVLYVPEGEQTLQMVETWIPFQVRWDLPETDGEGIACTSCLLRSADARNTSSRKILVRVNVGVCGQLWTPAEFSGYVAGNLPEDVCLQKSAKMVTAPREAGEKAFSLEEELALPTAAPKVEKLLHYHLQPELIEHKLMSDKVVFRGVALLHILYMGQDGQLHTWDFELPFSQYDELSNAYTDDAWAQITMAVTSLEAEPDTEDRLQLKVGLVGQYTICQQMHMESVTDAYSPRRQVTPVVEDMALFAVEDRFRQTVAAEQTIQTQGTPIDAVFYPDHARISQMGGENALQGQFQLLYKDEEGQYRTLVSRWEGTLPDTDGQQIHTQVDVTGKTRCSATGSGMTVNAEISTDSLVLSRLEMPVVKGVDMAELTEPDPNRPSLILRRAAGSSLWQLAKATNSTVDAISAANKLEGEPAPDRMLIIPVI